MRSTAPRPSTASTIRPGPTSIPTSRSTRPKVTTCRTIALPCTRPTVPPRSARLLDEAGEGLVANRLDVLAVLEHRAERLLDDLGVDLLAAERGERVRPVDRLRDAGRLREVEHAQPAHEGRGLGGELLRDAGHAQPHDLDLPLERGVADPVEERAPLERVVELARAVRGEHDRGLAPGADRAELGDRDLEVREHLEQERLELLVGAVDLVDQQHDLLLAIDRLEQRPADEELGPEELVLANRPLLRSADVEELARVVPLVDGVRDVEALVALEPDQARAERRCERLRGLGLAHACLALEQHGLLEREREEERCREPAVGQVVGLAKRGFELVDRAKAHGTERTPEHPSHPL